MEGEKDTTANGKGNTRPLETGNGSNENTPLGNLDNLILNPTSSPPICLYTVGENGVLVPYTFPSRDSDSQESQSENSDRVSNPNSSNPRMPDRRYIGVKLAADMVPNFDGNQPSISVFTRACQAASESVHPGDKIFLTKLIRNKIVGNADLYLQNIVEPESLKSLLDLLKSAFNPQHDLSQLQTKLSTVIQGKDESILQYGIRVSEILRHMLEAINEGYPASAVPGMRLGANKTAISCFTRGLNEAVENRMHNRQIDSLQDAINMAVVIENEIKCLKTLRLSQTQPLRENGYHRRPPPYVRNQAQYHYQNPNYQHENRYATTLKIDETENSNAYNSKPYSTRVCYNCGKQGHLRYKCRLPPKEQNPENERLVICGFCRGPNHYEGNCLAKKKYLIENKQNFQESYRNGVKEKENGSANLPLSAKPGPSQSKHVGSFAPRSPQK